MRIAVVVVAFPCLSETFILNQITGLLDHGHDIDIYAGESGEKAVHPDVEKYGLLARVRRPTWMPNSLSKRILKGLWLFIRYIKYSPSVLVRCLKIKTEANDDRFLKLFYESIPFLGQRSYDVLICHFGENGRKTIRLRQVGAVAGKVVTILHGADITRYPLAQPADVYNNLFANGDLFLPISERWKIRLIELGCPEEKIIVHHMGIDCKKFQYRSREIQPGKPINIVSVARLVEKKGIEYGVEAISLLDPASSKNINYSIIGDGPLKEDISRVIIALGLQNNISLLGWRHQSELIEILDGAHILLAPSVTASDGDQEGIPVSLMEAMAVGLPVISTFHSGIPELIEDGKSGFLVPERDAEALAEKLKYLLDNPAVWRDIGVSARSRVEAKFDVDLLNSKLIETCKSISDR